MSGRPSRKSAEIGLFRPFSALFALFRRVRRAPGKSRKRRKKAFFLRYPQMCLNPHPVLPFLAFSVLPRKNLKFTKDFLSLPNPQNPWKRQRKYQNNQGNSLLKINQGNPKNQGMEGQGISCSTPKSANRFARIGPSKRRGA